MATDARSWDWRLGLAGFLVFGGAIVLSGNCVLAQITPDATLGAQSSIVILLDSDLAVDLIEVGVIQRANVFHSFGEFNVKQERWVSGNKEEEKKEKEKNSDDAPPNSKPISSTPQPLVEAQGWVYGPNGEIILRAETPIVTPQQPWLITPSCGGTQTTKQ